MNKFKTIIVNAFVSVRVHFSIIFICLLLQAFTFGKPYRLLAWLNLIIVLGYGVYSVVKNNFINRELLWKIALIPCTFILIHMLAIGNLGVNKEIQHILLATFLALGVRQLACKNAIYIEKNLFFYSILIVVIYVVIQSIALYVFNRPYGTTKNPHYLAMYSASLLIISVANIEKARGVNRFVAMLMFLLLGSFLLHSSSRPTWIGLIVSSFVLVFFLHKRTRVWSFASIVFILVALSLSNLGNFQTRSDELLLHLDTEERVTIWQDVWTMQSDSNMKQWIVGHGLNSFKESFKPYSHYHLKHIDYNSPHNFILELMFISGIVGLAGFILLIYLIYSRLLLGIKSDLANKSIYMVLFAIITTNLFMIGITQPFFSSNNLNILGVVSGVILFLREKPQP